MNNHTYEIMPDVSVIIAAFNVEKYIDRAIQSVLSQQGVSVEVVVVDDASTDNTWSILSTINDPRIKKIKLDNNGGPSISRNEALSIASGRWVAVLDGDDLFLEGRLARCLSIAEAKKADIVVDNLRAFFEDNLKEECFFDFKRLKDGQFLSLASYIRNNQDFLGGSKAFGYMKPLISRSFLRKNGLSYDPDIRIGEDYMLMARCLAAGAVCVVDPTPGYRYTIRSGSISHRLILEDINRIDRADNKFCTECFLDKSARKAQKIRTRHLIEARTYTLLVDSIKNRYFRKAIKLIICHPFAARHLWRPLWVRIQRGLFW